MFFFNKSFFVACFGHDESRRTATIERVIIVLSLPFEYRAKQSMSANNSFCARKNGRDRIFYATILGVLSIGQSTHCKGAPSNSWLSQSTPVGYECLELNDQLCFGKIKRSKGHKTCINAATQHDNRAG